MTGRSTKSLVALESQKMRWQRRSILGKQTFSNNSSHTDGQCEESTGPIGKEAADISWNSMCTDQCGTIYIDY